MNLVHIITKNQDIATSKISPTSNLTLKESVAQKPSFLLISDSHASPVPALYSRMLKMGGDFPLGLLFPS